ncbi:hypothetical protein, partial [Candidatus Frankia alpina]|uniref:hypothetical protein n=1 Tax=Candidatus Frankia alpina TaxID=2699483 RepID=UPI001A98E92C
MAGATCRVRVCSVRTALSSFGLSPSSARMVGAIEVVSTGAGSTRPEWAAAPDDDERDVAVLRVGAAVLGNLALAASVDHAVRDDADDVGMADVTRRDAEVAGGASVRRGEPGGGQRAAGAADRVAGGVVGEQEGP